MKVLLIAVLVSCASVYAQTSTETTTTPVASDVAPTPVPQPVPQPVSSSSEEVKRPKNIISIGTNGFGWSGVGNTFDWNKNKSSIDEHTSSESNFKLNYSYVFESRIMLGIDFDFESSKSEIETTSGSKTKNETDAGEVGLSVGYNFNEDIYNSWWAKLTFAVGSYTSKDKDSSGTDKTDYGYNALYLSFGKRINLDSWGLRNVSYNPSLTIGSATTNGDAEEAGLDTISTARIDLIKIDILF